MRSPVRAFSSNHGGVCQFLRRLRGLRRRKLGRLLYIVGRLQLLLGRGALSVACSMRTDERLAFAPGFELGEGFAGFRIRPWGTKICVLDEPPVEGERAANRSAFRRTCDRGR